MNSSRYYFLFFLIAFLASNCGNPKISEKHQVPHQFENGSALVSFLDFHLLALLDLDKSDSEYSDLAILINEEIRKAVERINSQKFLREVYTAYESNSHQFTMAISDDAKIAVFSWDTGLEGAFPRIKNIALYQKNKKVIPTSLYGKPLYFHEIHTIVCNNKRSYLLHGTNSKSNLYRLDAYSLNSGQLEQKTIFPDNKNSIISAQDFNIEMDGSLIIIPEVEANSTKYHPLKLKHNLHDSQYVEAQSLADLH